MGRLCIVVSFVKEEHCAKIQGHGDIVTKHKGYGWEDKLKWGPQDTCLEKDDD